MKKANFSKKKISMIFLALFCFFILSGLFTSVQASIKDLPQSASRKGYFAHVEYRGDLNFDGNIEEIIKIGRPGREWKSSGYLLLSLNQEENKVKDLTPNPYPKHSKTSPFWSDFRTKDLNGDNIPELLVLDQRLEEIRFPGHASSPRSWLIYEWSYLENKYVNRSQFYPGFYNQLIEENLETINKEAHKSRYMFLKAWCSIYLHLVHKDMPRPWKSFKALWEKHAETDTFSFSTLKSVVERRIE